MWNHTAKCSSLQLVDASWWSSSRSAFASGSDVVLGNGLHAQDMALRYGKWGKSLPFRGDRACLQAISLLWSHNRPVLNRGLLKTTVCLLWRGHGYKSKSFFSRRFHVKLKGYIHRSIDSYNTYIYLYKRYWYFHIYIYALATNYICREMQSKPRRHRIRCFLRKILLSMLSLHTVNSSLVGIVSSYRQFCVSSWAPQVFARPMPAESMAERAREVWYSRKIGIFVSIINHIYI